MKSIPLRCSGHFPCHAFEKGFPGHFWFREPGLEDEFALEWKEDRLQLVKLDESQFGSVFVDFCSDQLKYRQKFGGGVSQAVAKAMGIKKGFRPDILDATAGLGTDAFVCASLGCRVHLVERVPLVVMLLHDGLRRAQEDEQIGEWVRERMFLSFGDLIQDDLSLPFSPQVVYIDTMFPEKKKSALVKKEMRTLQAIVGTDKDAGLLFKKACQIAGKRVVVKRPILADSLGEALPDTVIKTKNYRFDVYLMEF